MLLRFEGCKAPSERPFLLVASFTTLIRRKTGIYTQAEKSPSKSKVSISILYRCWAPPPFWELFLLRKLPIGGLSKNVNNISVIWQKTFAQSLLRHLKYNIKYEMRYRKMSIISLNREHRKTFQKCKILSFVHSSYFFGPLMKFLPNFTRK